MMPEIPWNLQGIDPDARANAEASARRAGVDVSQWLNSMIRQTSFGQTGYPHHSMAGPVNPAYSYMPPPSPHMANGYAASQPYQSDPMLGDGVSRLNSQINNLSNRLDALARAGADTAIPNSNPPLFGGAPSVSQASAPVNSLASSEDTNAIREIEQTLKNIVDVIEVTDGRTKKSLDEIWARVESLKTDPQNGQPLVSPSGRIPDALAPGVSQKRPVRTPKTRFELRRDRRHKLPMPDEMAGNETGLSPNNAGQTEFDPLSSNGPGNPHPDFVSLARSLEAALEKSNAGGHLVTQPDIAALKDEVRALAEQIADASSGSRGYLEGQKALQEKLEQISAELDQSGQNIENIPGIDSEFHSLHSHLETISSQLKNSSNVSGVLTGIEQKIGMLFDQVQVAQAQAQAQARETEQGHENLPSHFAEIEQKLGLLFEQLQQTQNRSVEPAQQGAVETAQMADIEHRIGLLFDQLQQSQKNTIDASREIAGETAQLAVREATQEAVRAAAEHVAKYLPERISGNEIEIVRNLEAGLNEVRANAAHADQQTQMTLSSVQDSLHAIMDRLTFADNTDSGTGRREAQNGAPTSNEADPIQMASTPEKPTIPEKAPLEKAPPIEHETAEAAIAPGAELADREETKASPTLADHESGETVNLALSGDGNTEEMEDAAPESVRPLEPGSGCPAPRLDEQPRDDTQNAVEPIHSAQKQTSPDVQIKPELGVDAATSLRNASTNEELLAAARRAARNAAHASSSAKPPKRGLRDRFRRREKKPVKSRTPAKPETTGGDKVLGLPRKPVLLTSAAILLFVGSMKIYGLMANRADGNEGVGPASVTLSPAIGTDENNANPETEISPQAPTGAQGFVDPANVSLFAPPQKPLEVSEYDSAEAVPQFEEVTIVGPASNQDVTGSLPSAGEDLANPVPGTDIQVVSVPPANSSLAYTGNNLNSVEPMESETLPEAIANPALRQAAMDGDSAAQYEIASRLAEGRGTAPNLELAATWYQRAAAQDLAPAQYRLGSMYEKGRGLEEDRNIARVWYQRAAELGNRKAMHNLAVLYADGVNGEPDMASAVLWFRKAAEFGLNDSQFNLGILYARGLGVPRNSAEAYKWLSIVAANGDVDAGERRDAIAGELDQQTLTATRLAVQTWRAESVIAAANTVRLPVEGWGDTTANSQTMELPGRDLIRNSQKLLNQLGFEAGPADGVWGPRTQTAITQFQTRENIPPSGRLTPQIFRNLQQASARNAGA